jgi:hypothetical protein
MGERPRRSHTVDDGVATCLNESFGPRISLLSSTRYPVIAGPLARGAVHETDSVDGPALASVRFPGAAGAASGVVRARV